MTETKYIEFMNPIELNRLLKESKYKNKSQLCKIMRTPTANFNRLSKGLSARLELVRYFEDQFKGKQFKKIKTIDPTTFRQESMRRCIKLDKEMLEKFNKKSKWSFITLKRYLYHTEEFFYDWNKVVEISDFISTFKIESKSKQEEFAKNFQKPNFIKNSNKELGRTRKQYSTATRQLFFQVKDWKQIFDMLDITMTRIGLETGVKAPTIRSSIRSKNNSVPCKMAEDITQLLLGRYNSRKDKEKLGKLPERVKIINPYLIEKECDLRGITQSQLCTLVDTFSESTIKTYYHKNYGTTGPRFDVMIDITKAVLSVPVLGREDSEKFLAKKLGKKDEHILLDNSGQPKLAKEPIWNFYEAQKEWMERDRKKIAGLPKVGPLTNISKNDYQE